ncbi:hypothetical protein [Oceanivirga miroungae]|uniref:Uncharacterized protein n=1 Tax=Oceanivirga miroungae TaxID=1130046 RepID=A0A6I8M7Z5_9FUSO|nr:hypothetical protein [Oceanivirga miroungae]VWL85539.1 hypothetical protein OMES3154_00825 [Oceanivirga miroungae]
MKRLLLLLITTLSFITFSHAPTIEIEEDEPGYIFVQAGFSNGESAYNLPVIVVQDKNYNGAYKTWEGKLILFEGVFDEDGSIVLPKPKTKKYTVIFNGGVGHVTEKKGIPLKKEEKDAWEKAIKEDEILGEWKDIYTGKVK